MKKSLIATAGVAAFAVAAVPFAGVFAATQVTSQSFQDNLSVTISDSCTFRSEVNSAAATDFERNFTATVAAGQLAEFTMADGEPTMSVVCNTDTSNWEIQAIGGTSVAEGATGVTTLTGTTPSEGDAPTIATGTAVSGDTSNWMFKVETTTPVSPYGTWAAVPDSLTKVATGTASAAGTATGTTFTPSYRVYASPSQAADTYTGNVSYLVVYPSA